jgi:hypothetical protein
MCSSVFTLIQEFHHIHRQITFLLHSFPKENANQTVMAVTVLKIYLICTKLLYGTLRVKVCMRFINTQKIFHIIMVQEVNNNE